MITDGQTNKVYFSALLPKRAPKTFYGLRMILDKYDVAYDKLPGTKDIWCRDYMPIQISEDRFAGYVYNPDYLQESEEDKNTITNGNAVCMNLGMNLKNSENSLIIDGGNIIKCKDKIIMTEKVVIENQATYSKSELKNALEKHFNAEVIFLPWDRCEYFGHADGLVRYIGNDRVLITYYRQYSSAFVDKVVKILKKHFTEVFELRFPMVREHKNSWAYINWLQTSQVLILPKFGYIEDAMVLQQIKKLMPDYEGRIEQIDAQDLIIDGGCLNCATWNVYSETREKEINRLTAYKQDLIQYILERYDEIAKLSDDFKDRIEFTPRLTRDKIYQKASRIYSIMQLRCMMAEVEKNYRKNLEEIIRIT